MDIFESLENLNVSEGCFDEIMGLVEELLSEDIEETIRKVHGKPRYDKNDKPINKSAELQDKIVNMQSKEKEDALKRAKAKSTKAWHETLLNRGVGMEVGSRAWQDAQIEKALNRRDERNYNKMHGTR